ncbi:hypothetical protein N7470_007238 [Penicillium chermesinum]|nr:hypothetical protein N7470_007238 [Penicillium chermesinum]
MSARQKMLAQKRHDFFMTEMRDYAASLTNATGNILDPEVIFVASGKEKRNGNTARTVTDIGEASSGNSGKKRVDKPRSMAVRQEAMSFTQGKRQEGHEKQVAKWHREVEGLQAESDLAKRYLSAGRFISSIAKESRESLEAEILTFQLDTLVQIYALATKKSIPYSQTSVLGLIWSTVLKISRLQQSVTADIAACVVSVTNALRLPQVDLQANSTRRLPFRFVRLTSANPGFHETQSPIEFQLAHAGPFLDRNMDSAPDSRVRDFEPDKWQRQVLDQIDARESVFVVAPTSAGKTFISFYAMKQVLEDDDDGVLVYVAPTKALVNQIAAEVQARFSKKYPKKCSGKSVWAIHTRDYRINNPVNCQILITVPHILQTMLLAPVNARTWSSKVRRIIFDEVHCIGQAQDGVVWEQLLLMSCCPIVALSATVGNPQEFCDWLSMAQRANSIKLRLYIYHPPKQFTFSGLFQPHLMPALGLEDTAEMEFIHPVASIIDRSRGIPDDLSLEPRDCLMLWKAMKKHETSTFPVEESLDPHFCLPQIVRKIDVVRWEARLKALLREWVMNTASPFDFVLTELTNTKCAESKTQSGTGPSPQKLDLTYQPRTLNPDDLLNTTLPLICSLHDLNALPALFFNYDRSMCEKLCRILWDSLVAAEGSWKKSSSAWKKKVAEWEEWKLNKEKLAKKKKPSASKIRGAEDDDLSRAERIRQKLSTGDFEEYAKQLRSRGVADWLISALQRGIGVHHAGMNRKYRQVCEMLFRKGYLRVVIATGTLALGINMPCKTVVFSGDSVFLTALNYRQAAGRAGRRGFDMLGNVVFQGIPYSKVCRLISSRLPHLNGHFPITTSLVLRLCSLLYGSKYAPYAVNAVNSILSCARIYLGGPKMKDTVLHHLRFSIEYLRRNQLLDRHGAPLNFAGCVSHLYYTENSSFAFHALLNAGYFHTLCANVVRQPKNTLLTLMLVLSHLFGRQNLRHATLEQMQSNVRKGTSLVVLPPMPKKALKVLHQHNKDTLDVYVAYVTTFIDQHIVDPDRTLPFTDTNCGGSESWSELGIPNITPAKDTYVISPFYALSGHSDKWCKISDLCETIRGGVWLEEAVVPSMMGYPDGAALNAYLFDFFKHGNIRALEQENGIRKGDIWFLLNDFSLVLATVVTSLENFLKLTPGTEIDMLDIMGAGEDHEAAVDSTLDELDMRKIQTPKPAIQTKPQQDQKSQKTSRALATSIIAESWDDISSDETGQGNDDCEGTSNRPKQTGTNAQAIEMEIGVDRSEPERLSESSWKKLTAGMKVF